MYCDLITRTTPGVPFVVSIIFLISSSDFPRVKKNWWLIKLLARGWVLLSTYTKHHFKIYNHCSKKGKYRATSHYPLRGTQIYKDQSIWQKLGSNQSIWQEILIWKLPFTSMKKLIRKYISLSKQYARDWYINWTWRYISVKFYTPESNFLLSPFLVISVRVK